MRYTAALVLLLAAGPAAAQQVMVVQAWARATAPHQENGAAYLTITSKQDDVLVGVDSDTGGMAMLHATAQSNGVSSMRDIDHLRLPAGTPVALSPRGMHVMLMGLKHPLVAGQVVHLTLHLLHGGIVEVAASVRPIGDAGPAP